MESARAALSVLATESFFCGVCAHAATGKSMVNAQRKIRPCMAVRFVNVCAGSVAGHIPQIARKSVPGMGDSDYAVRTGGAREREWSAHADSCEGAAVSTRRESCRENSGRSGGAASDEARRPRAVHAEHSASLCAW